MPGFGFGPVLPVYSLWYRFGVSSELRIRRLRGILWILLHRLGLVSCLRLLVVVRMVYNTVVNVS